MGLFFSEDAQRAGVILAAVEASMRNISTHQENIIAANNRLYLLGLGFSDGVGMLSYPNFGGPNKALNHPDVFLLAAMAERVGIDFRVLVLQRNANEILKSTIKRGFGGPEESRILLDNAAALYAQLRLLDRNFFHCLDYNDLFALRINGSSQPIMKDKKNRLAQFMHPIVVPPLIDAMLQKVNPVSGASSESLSKRNMTANMALSEFQLESRLLLVKELCQ